MYTIPKCSISSNTPPCNFSTSCWIRNNQLRDKTSNRSNASTEIQTITQPNTQSNL